MNHDKQEEEELFSFSLENAEDHMILMHRDAHFAGNFQQMLKYYESGGKGASPEIELKRIQQLAAMEEKLNQNLAPMLLSPLDAQIIRKARETYISLRELYELPNPKRRIPRLIADLILSEEEDPAAEIAAIVAEKELIVPELLALLRSESFADPLFPGYGFAPELAARCLGAIGDKRAIISLFEAIGESDLFAEEGILSSLKAIGTPAKQFLLKILPAKPLDRDNERAAIALLQFKEEPDVSSCALEMLFDPSVIADSFLASHLILICEGLEDSEQRKRLLLLSESTHFPKPLKAEILSILNSWKS